MNITVVPVGTTTPTELTLDQARAAIEDHCRAQRRSDAESACAEATNACQFDLCEAERWLCVAQTSYEAARNPSEVVLEDAAGMPKYEVEPQDPESQVALAHVAQLAVAKSMAAIGEGFLSADCSNSGLRNDTATSWNTEGPDPVGVDPGAPAMELFASTLAEALYVGELAADLGTQRTLGVAERDASAIGDLGRAARLTWFDQNLSRVLAAQAQVGGTVFGTVAAPTDWTLDAGEYADNVLRNVGIGVVPPCGVNCTRALQELRRSGVSFGSLVPVIPSAGPYVFSASEDQLSGLIQIVAMNLNSRIAYDATIYAGTTPEAFANSIDVTLGDLLQAVEQMRYEDIVYTRPRGVALAEPIRISPDASGNQRSESMWDPTTLNGPVPPPAMHYITRARLAQAWTGAQTFAGARSLRLPILRPERAYLFAYATALASEAMAVSFVACPGGTCNSGDALVGLQSIVQQGNARRALDVEVCADATSNVRVRIFGLRAQPDEAEFRLVQGLDGLRCAVQGARAGQPCTDMVTYPLIAPSDSWAFVHDPLDPGDTRTSRLYAVQFDNVPAASGETYVLRRRSGASEGFGAYEAIAGFSHDVTSSTCMTVPYDWMSYTEAARVFEFGSDARASDRNCAGVPDRLPLEDEIIDDGDEFEDSWQYHLRVASAAAAHADQLGQDLIASGLRIDEESARHVDDIQELCGTHVNVDLFSGGHISTTTCDEPSGGTGCPSGYTCIGTSCVSADILGDDDSAQREALEDCLGLGEGGAIIPVVALGNHALCAWVHNDHPDQLCGGTEPCPYVMPEDGVCTLPAPLSTTHHVVAVTNEVTTSPPDPPDIGQVVGLVGSVGPDGEPLPGTILPGPRCTDRVLTALGNLRDDTLSEGDRLVEIEAIRESGFFDYENIRSVAARIGWVGEVGNYSHIQVDGGPMRDNMGNVIGSTGSPSGGPATSWPCYMSTVGTEEYPLRHRFVNCGTTSDPGSRPMMNWRLGRAAVVLTAFTDLGLGNHRLPALPYGSTAANMAGLDYADALLGGQSYSLASSANFSGYELSGAIYGLRDGAPSGYELWRSANSVRARYMSEDGSNGAWISTSGDEHLWAHTNTTRPLAFMDFGYQVADGDRTRAEAIARRLWEGLGTVRGDSVAIATGFWDPVPLTDGVDLPDVRPAHGVTEQDRAAASGRLFLRALRRKDDDWNTVYLNHGRESCCGGGTHVQHLTHIFSVPVWDMGGHNVVSLFPTSDHSGEEPPAGYGAYITRRDLIDAMELACYVSSLEPPPPDMVTDEDRPQIRSVNDVNQVEFFAERVAQSFDAMARVQIVRDVPQDVIDRLTSENVGNTTSEGSSSSDRVTGAYGRMLSDFRNELRRMGESPAHIAAIIRTIGAELRIFEREQAIFDRDVELQFLQLTVDVLHSLSTCLSAAQGSVGSGIDDHGATARQGYAVAICAIQGVIAILKGVMTGLAVANLADERANVVERFADRLSGLFDALDSERTAYLNAIDRVQALAGQLRDSRTAARSALARALFASSDAAGRQYATNTVMRRMYDINLQRYDDALAAAVRSAAIARFAIEQRFGVDLETQQCTQLVDSPSTWANDICTATGVDYGALRDPDAEFDEATIRRMFIGDYVRRLEQYVDSYRFDYPYQSGDDLMVMSLRDDVVRAQSTCVSEVSNWIGSSNDLFSAVLPAEDGSPGAGAGWLQRGCVGDSPYSNCMSIIEVDGPRYVTSSSVKPPVFARSSAHAPRGFEVLFAPNPSGGTYAGDYQNGASYTQAVTLPAGLYRLSWYQRGAIENNPAVAVRPLTGSLTTSSIIDCEPRPLQDTWKRYFQVIEVPGSMAGQTFLVGVFAMSVTGTPEQVLQVAGIQLEHVSGTPTETSWRSDGNSGLMSSGGTRFGPGLFTATTAPGYGYVDDCVAGEPEAFRGAWRYACAQLCSGGFSGHCDPDESPQQFCYWELPFGLDEDRLLSRGGDFGGGFAFGNYNYRSGEIAVNVVGTDVRDCAGTNAAACYSTAGIPYSLIHTAPATSALSAGHYSIRAHDGSLHPVDLFDGHIESARALAAERYLTNPLSSADASLINDYTRGELRGRPMTGNYRLLIWDNGEVDFGAIEDVQILWRYRYFTRTGAAYTCGE